MGEKTKFAKGNLEKKQIILKNREIKNSKAIARKGVRGVKRSPKNTRTKPAVVRTIARGTAIILAATVTGEKLPKVLANNGSVPSQAAKETEKQLKMNKAAGFLTRFCGKIL